MPLYEVRREREAVGWFDLEKHTASSLKGLFWGLRGDKAHFLKQIPKDLRDFPITEMHYVGIRRDLQFQKTGKILTALATRQISLDYGGVGILEVDPRQDLCEDDLYMKEISWRMKLYESVGWVAFQSLPGNPWPYRPFMFMDLSKPVDPIENDLFVKEIEEDDGNSLNRIQALCDPELNE